MFAHASNASNASICFSFWQTMVQHNLLGFWCRKWFSSPEFVFAIIYNKYGSSFQDDVITANSVAYLWQATFLEHDKEERHRIKNSQHRFFEHPAPQKEARWPYDCVYCVHSDQLELWALSLAAGEIRKHFPRRIAWNSQGVCNHWLWKARRISYDKLFFLRQHTAGEVKVALFVVRFHLSGVVFLAQGHDRSCLVLSKKRIWIFFWIFLMSC